MYTLSFNASQKQQRNQDNFLFCNVGYLLWWFMWRCLNIPCRVKQPFHWNFNI